MIKNCIVVSLYYPHHPICWNQRYIITMVVLMDIV